MKFATQTYIAPPTNVFENGSDQPTFSTTPYKGLLFNIVWLKLIRSSGSSKRLTVGNLTNYNILTCFRYKLRAHHHKTRTKNVNKTIFFSHFFHTNACCFFQKNHTTYLLGSADLSVLVLLLLYPTSLATSTCYVKFIWMYLTH